MKPIRSLPRTAALLTLALLAGCSFGAGDPAPDWEALGQDLHYNIYLDDYRTARRWTLDQNGETVPEEEQFVTLYDALTGEPQCKVLQRQETGEEYSVDGTLISGGRTIQDYCALYDLEGNLLHDWQPCWYVGGFGDFVIRQNRSLMFYEETLPADFTSELWNFRTGQTHLEEVGQVKALEEGRTAVLMNAVYRPLGVVDREGQAVSGFPAPAQYAYITDTWNGGMIASSRAFLAEGVGAERYYLLDRNFDELLDRQSLSPGWLPCKYIQFSDTQDNGSEQRGLMDESGAVALPLEEGQYAAYYDDELAIVEQGEYDSDSNPIRKHLVRIQDGEVLAGDCDGLDFAGTYERREAAERFMARRGDTLQILNRKGSILHERDIPGLEYMHYLTNGSYRCSLLRGDEYVDIIVDAELNTLVSAETYDNLYQATEWNTQTPFYYPVLIANQRNPNGWQSRTDVLDMQGNVMVAGLNMVYQVGPDRLAVRKGFEIGLMDWQGNWIAKRSIFSELVDD